MQAKRISALLLTSALFLPLFAEPPQPAEVLPAGALVYLEAHGSGRLVRQFKEDKVVQQLQEMDLRVGPQVTATSTTGNTGGAAM